MHLSNSIDSFVSLGTIVTKFKGMHFITTWCGIHVSLAIIFNFFLTNTYDYIDELGTYIPHIDIPYLAEDSDI